MDKEYLIQKWLDHDLNVDEFEAFKQLEDYDSLMRLSQGLDNFKAPNFDEKLQLDFITERLKDEEKKQLTIKPLLRIAAIVIITLSGFWFFNNSKDITTTTLASQKTNIVLPDNSQVSLNASSQLVFSNNNWEDNREVNLDGEAFFKVAKGSTFDVKTNTGIVRVLGTQFNVKQRDHYFEVICYEGLVGVFHENREPIKLNPGDSFLVIDGEIISKSKVETTAPFWLLNESHFESMPYKHVISEFERQYNVTIDTKYINLNQLFTGSFSHDNFLVAIKSITLPLNLSYSKENSTVTLISE